MQFGFYYLGGEGGGAVAKDEVPQCYARGPPA